MQYTNLINYLTSLGHGHPSIDTVIHGDYEEIFALEKTVDSGVMYWIETPDINPKGDADYLEQQFNCAIVVCIPTKPGDISQNILSKDRAHSYLMQVIRKLISDQEDEKISDVGISSIQIDPIQISADNRVGWRAEVPINQSVCDQLDDYPDVTHPSFIFETGSVTEVANDTLTGYVRQWTIYTNGTKVISSAESLIIDDIVEDDTVYIELIYEGKNHVLAASITLTDNTEAVSVPYTNNPFK